MAFNKGIRLAIVRAAVCSAAGLCTESATAESTNTIYLPSDVCRSNWSQVFLGTSDGRMGNSSTTDMYPVICIAGENRSATDTNDDARIYYDDNNGNTGQNFSCTAYKVDEDWSSVVYIGLKYGCGTAGGCSGDPGIYAASGFIHFDNIWHGAGYQTAIGCWIPTQTTESSWVLSLMVDTD